MAGQVKVNISSDEASAIVQADSTTQGALDPRMTSTQRDAIASPATGLRIYNTTTGQHEEYNGSTWRAIGTGVGAMTSFTVAGDSGSSQTISNGNTLTVAGGTGIDTVASATDTLTLNIDSTVATLTGSQTLTNKTLTTPVVNTGDINTPDIDGGTIDGTTIGGATPAAGTFTTATATNLLFAASTELTIATGAVTRTQAVHTIDTEADAASDDLDTISGGSANMVLIIRADNAARTVVVKHNTGNILCPAAADITLDELYKEVWLKYDGAQSKWIVVFASGGSGSGATTALDNLASVAINTSLISDADSTDDLGSTANYWRNGYVDTMYLSEQAAPSTPAAGKVVVYPKTDGKLYLKDDAGTETDLTATGGAGGDTDAIHDNVAGEIASIAEKTTPAAADLLLIEDSADSNAKKKVQVGNLPSGDLVLLDNCSGVVGAGGVASLTFPSSGSLPTGYFALKLVMSVRGEVAAVSGGLHIQPNGDTTAGNYRGQTNAGQGTSEVTSENNGAEATITTGVLIPGNSAPANHFGSVEVTIMDYNSSARIKSSVGNISFIQNTTTGNFIVATVGGVWNSTAAVTTLVVKCASGDIAEGTSYRLYGLT